MKKNAWYCAEEIRKRIDGAPVFNDIIHSFLTERSNAFFFNKAYLVQYNTASSIPQKQSVPGYHYITKVMTFFEKHYHNEELYFEYIKEGCLETNQEPCDKCVNVEWVGPRCSRVPNLLCQIQRTKGTTFHFLILYLNNNSQWRLKSN